MKTIEEIKEIIARKVAGQGNQIDLGGGVNEALNAICEVLENAAPGPIEVTGSKYTTTILGQSVFNFMPDGGEITLDEAIEAYLNNRIIVLNVDDNTDRATVIGYVGDIDQRRLICAPGRDNKPIVWMPEQKG